MIYSFEIKQLYMYIQTKTKENKLRILIQQANYTDLATAACRRS
jgi:hypothetical protein